MHEVIAASPLSFRRGAGSDGAGGFTTVLQSGDSFMGSTVSALHFSQFGLNDNSQLAFLASLADGRSGVYRASVTATPKPPAP